MGESVGIEDDDPVVATSLISVVAVEREEVIAVVGDDRTGFLLGVCEDIGVWQSAQLGALGDGAGVVAAVAELLGDCG